MIPVLTSCAIIAPRSVCCLHHRHTDTPFLRFGLSPRPHRSLHLGFGINEEVGAVHNTVPFFEPGSYFVRVAVFAAEFEETGLEFAFAFVNKGDVSLAGGENSGNWNGKALA